MAYYLAARHLGKTTEQWDALQWWEQRLYWEGYVMEGLVEDNEDSDHNPDLTDERVHQSGGTTITERDYRSDLSESPDNFTGGSGLVEQPLE